MVTESVDEITGAYTLKNFKFASFPFIFHLHRRYELPACVKFPTKEKVRIFSTIMRWHFKRSRIDNYCAVFFQLVSPRTNDQRWRDNFCKLVAVTGNAVLEYSVDSRNRGLMRMMRLGEKKQELLHNSFDIYAECRRWVCKVSVEWCVMLRGGYQRFGYNRVFLMSDNRVAYLQIPRAECLFKKNSN